ncbi:X2-like carbohydrate binding domain-containing protein, partial [Clostridium ihumii]|uniref:X2-like carbohydrate binding domain-containing protein n=1 Tax=Clostridium ihumii TaxID=1470356 RepID=UPI003D3499DF
GESTITVTFNDAATTVSTVKLTVSDSTIRGTAPSITTKTATFDKKTEAQNDVEIVFGLGTEDLVATGVSSVKIGEDVLKVDTDYVVEGTKLKLKKETLSKLKEGESTITVTFNDAATTVSTVKLTVSDSDSI